MKPLRFIALSLILIWQTIAGPGAPKTVHVNSYTRKDGTVVREHWRSAPNSGTYPSNPTSIGIYNGPATIPLTTTVTPQPTQVAPIPQRHEPKPQPQKVAEPIPVEFKPTVRVDTSDPALEYQRASAAKGFPESQYTMGMRHLTGNGVEKDRAKAFEFLKSASDGGSLRAREKLIDLRAEDREAAKSAEQKEQP